MYLFDALFNLIKWFYLILCGCKVLFVLSVPGGVKSAALSDSQIDMGAVDSGIPAYDTITLPQNWSNSYKRGRQNSAFVKRSAHNDYPPHDPRYNKVVDEIKHFNGLHHVADGSSDSDDVSRPTSPTTNGGGPDTSYG